jgi:hypothetical protein
MKLGMFIMKIIKLTCALLLTAWVSSANATLIFDFSFTNPPNNGGGIVTGEILGLIDNQSSAATSVRILTSSEGYGVGEYAVNSSNNNFYVFNGALSSMSFNGYGPYVDTNNTGSYSLNLNSSGLTSLSPSGQSPEAVSDFASSQRLVEATAPGTVILLSLGIAGLFVSRNRKNS